MVLNLHSFWGYNHGEGIGQAFDFFRESTSICAVNIFVLISGYFGIKWKLKGCYNLLFQCAFYSFSVYFFAVAIGAISFEMNSFLNCFGCYTLSWGFITNYIVLYFLAPLINKFAEFVTKKELFTTILVLILVENTLCITTQILNFVVLYLIGKILSTSDSLLYSVKRPWKWYLLCTIVITMITYGLFKFTPINNAVRMTMFPLGFNYTSPFIILQAVFIFIAFKQMKFTNRFINWCSASCLSIYLIHMHPAIKKIGYYSITGTLYNLPGVQHFVYLLLLIICIFFGCILIDKIRIIISDFVYVILSKIISFIPSKLLQIDTYLPKSIKTIL